MGCRLWGRTESDTTEATQQKQQLLEDDISLCIISHFGVHFVIFFPIHVLIHMQDSEKEE